MPPSRSRAVRAMQLALVCTAALVPIASCSSVAFQRPTQFGLDGDPDAGQLHLLADGSFTLALQSAALDLRWDAAGTWQECGNDYVRLSVLDAGVQAPLGLTNEDGSIGTFRPGTELFAWTDGDAATFWLVPFVTAFDEGEFWELPTNLPSRVITLLLTSRVDGCYRAANTPGDDAKAMTYVAAMEGQDGRIELRADHSFFFHMRSELAGQPADCVAAGSWWPHQCSLGVESIWLIVEKQSGTFCFPQRVTVWISGNRLTFGDPCPEWSLLSSPQSHAGSTIRR